MISLLFSMRFSVGYIYILLAYAVSIIVYSYYSKCLLIYCSAICNNSTRYQKFTLIERSSCISKENAKAITNITASQVILSTENNTIQRNEEFVPITRYLQEKKAFTVIFSDKVNYGFSNRLRSMRGILILAILNNASFCVKYDNYFSVMDERLKVLRCKSNISRQYWNRTYFLNKLKNNPCDYRIDQNTEIDTNYDITDQLVKCIHFSKDFKVMQNMIHNNNLQNYLTNFFFHPKPYIINYGNSILSQMKGIKIGIQLRFGGKTASSHEKFTFLNPNRMDTIIKSIETVISKRKAPYSVFLSSDSSAAKKYLSPLHIPILTAEKFQIGHTNRQIFSFYERAICDLYILSKCDILFHTYWSSYGEIAKNLSKSSQCYLLRN